MLRRHTNKLKLFCCFFVNKTKQEKVIRLEHPALSRTEQRARTRRLTTDCITQCIIAIALTFKITKEPPRPLLHVSFCCLGVQQTLRPALWALRAFLAQTLEAYQLVVRCGSRRLIDGNFSSFGSAPGVHGSNDAILSESHRS